MGNKCNLWDPNQENTCGYCIYAKRITSFLFPQPAENLSLTF